MDNAQEHALLAELHSRSAGWAREQFAIYLPQLEDALLAAASGGADETTRDIYASHCRKVERLRHTTHRYFHRRLEKRLAPVWAPAMPDYDERTYRELAAALDATGREDLRRFRRAVLPDTFIAACRDTLQVMEFDPRAEAFALGLFHERFTAALPSLYGQLTRLVRDVSPAPNATLLGWIAHIEQQLQDNSLDAARRSLAVNRLRQLRRQLPEGTGSDPSLTARWSDPYREETPVEDIDDESLMEETRRLFRPLFASDSVPEDAKTLLSRLQPIVLETALRDRRRFFQPLHPIRQLLNQVVATVKHWPGADAMEKRRMLKTVDELAERARREFGGNARLFDELKSDFEAYSRRHASPTRSEAVAHGVEDLLRRRVADYRYPPGVGKLLLGPWRRVLEHYRAYYGDDSEPFRRALALVDDILWYIHPHADAADQQRAKALEPALERTLRVGFEAVGLNAASARRIFDQLRRLHHQPDKALASAAAQSEK